MKAGMLRPRSPERICWGCDKLCGADDLACGGGTIRTPHPIEMFGDTWADEQEAAEKAASLARTASCATSPATTR